VVEVVVEVEGALGRLLGMMGEQVRRQLVLPLGCLY